jgi:predicted nucleic acid-binding protein
MTVVSDTSPLNYLVITDLAHVLAALFGRIVVPDAVLGELQSPSAPELVRQWLLRIPPWVEVRTAPATRPELMGLDAGEREVISLGLEVKADLVLLDEARGRRAAVEQGLTVAGTLGVLQRAARRGLVDLPDAIDRLRRTTFRVSPRLLGSLNERA